MRVLARLVMITGPAIVAAGLLAAAPAYADTSCKWGPNTAFNPGATVVSNSVQYSCENTGDGVPFWHEDGLTDNPDSVQGYGYGGDASDFSANAGLVNGYTGYMEYSDGGGGWTQTGYTLQDIYDSSGNIDPPDDPGILQS
jgi:hypothetical protein